MALLIMGLYVTLSIIDTQHNNVLPYAECRYAECHILFIVMLSINMLNVVMLSVVASFLQTCYSASIPFQDQPIQHVRILCWVMTTPHHHESRAQRYKTFL